MKQLISFAFLMFYFLVNGSAQEIDEFRWFGDDYEDGLFLSLGANHVRLSNNEAPNPRNHKFSGTTFKLDLKDVNFEDDRYSLFAERPISATIDNILLTGIVDFVVAEGIGRPYAPYFFIQEYKKARQGPESDPQAQLLGEMLVAQEINQNKQPVY